MKKKWAAKKYYYYLSFLVIVLMSSCKLTKFKIAKEPLDSYFETNPSFRENHTGLLVYDPETSTTIFDYNSQKHFTPVSNTKLLTYFATIELMGDSIPALEYCIVNDTLFFTGTGDPTLLYENFDYSKTLNFLKDQSNPLVYVEKPMEDNRFGPGWAWDDYPYYYSAEKSSFPIYGNVVRFIQGDTIDALQVIPKFFADHVIMLKDTSLPDYEITRKEITNEFTIRYRDDTTTIEEFVPFAYNPKLFLTLFSDTLHRTIEQKTTFPNCQKHTIYSVPTDSVSKYILIESDNFLAEQMLLMISNQLGDTLSSAKVIEYMMENRLVGLQQHINWVDGSGLSRYNQVTPHAMITILNKIYREVPKEKLFEMLPESGKNGTLETSFDNLSGKIHAKTGSMSHVYNLSGFLETNSGKIILFSFMNNNFAISFSELKMEMERVLNVFVNDY